MKLLFGVLFLFVSSAAPQEPPKDGTFCHISHLAPVLCNRLNDNKSCMSDDGWKGCKDGARMEENGMCSMFCDKSRCRCCSVLERKE